MATRSGSVDVGMIMWLLDAGLDHAEVADALQHRSGLLGLAGTADMREVEAAAAEGDERATVALDVWTLRVSQAIAAMIAAARGIDGLVFTGGIGENSASFAIDCSQRLTWLGDSFEVYVIEAREDIEIARATRQLL